MKNTLLIESRDIFRTLPSVCDAAFLTLSGLQLLFILPKKLYYMFGNAVKITLEISTREILES